MIQKLTTLQTRSLLRSDSSTYWHKFLIPRLPLLLTPHRAEGLENFRREFAVVARTVKEQNSTHERYKNFASTLSWALDFAENVKDDVGENAELRFMQAIRTIFYFVSRLCNQEWGLANNSAESQQVSNTTAEIPSRRDPLYHPQIVRKRKYMREQRLQRLHNEVLESQQNHCSRSYSTPVKSNPHYIRRKGKLITPFDCIRQDSSKCIVPFELTVKEKSNIDDDLELPSKYVEVRYQDKTFSDFIPLQKVHFIYQKVSRHHAVDRKAFSENGGVGRVQVDGQVYDTMIKISKKAYTKRLSWSKPRFFTEVRIPLPKRRIEISVPIVPSCYVRVLDAQRLKECPIWEAFEICQHDICGRALFKIEFLEQVDGTRILTSLIGMIVEKNSSNYGDAIFSLLDPPRGELK